MAIRGVHSSPIAINSIKDTVGNAKLRSKVEPSDLIVMDTMSQQLSFDDAEFEELMRGLEEVAEDDCVSKTSYKLCPNCDIDMLPDINNMLQCKQCGLVIECITENTNYEPSMNMYNTMGSEHIPIRCVGKNSFRIQHELRVNTSQYAVVQEANMRRQLENRNFHSEGLKIPKSVILSTVDKYKTIRKSSKIHRGDVLKGILASIVYYECLTHGIVRKPKEICEWFDISEKDMSKGDKILRTLEEDKVINLPINQSNEEEYVSSYLTRMDMSQRYKPQMLEILERMETLRVGNPNARLSTKVSALIFMIVLSDNIDKQAEDIATEFSIAVPTFKSFYTDIVKRKKNLQDLFDKFNITVYDKLPRKRRKNVPAML